MRAAEKRIAVRLQEEKRRTYMAALIIFVLFLVSTISTEYQPFELFANMENFWDFLFQDLLPPRLTDPQMIVEGVIQTVSMAIVATLLAAVLSMILAFLGAEATCPWKPLRKLVRLIASIQRNIPNMIWIFILIDRKSVV